MFEPLIKQVTKVIDRYEERAERPSEEATKHALVLPFIRDVLGVDYLNPEEVIPEFTADIGERKGEKVDYAVCRDDEPVILIECKALYSALSNAATVQLERYVNSRLGVSLGILTNGRHYRFYADLDKPNILDAEPFLSVDLLDLSPEAGERLKLFHFDCFDVDAIKEAGRKWKTVAALVRALEREWAEPSPGYISHFAKPLHQGVLFESVRKKYAGYLKEAHSLFLNEQDSGEQIPEDWQSLTEIETAHGPPQCVRFPDGSITNVGVWSKLLTAVALKLDSEGHIRPNNISRKMRYIIYIPSLEYKLKKSLELSNGLVTNINLSAKDCLGRSILFLKEFGYDPADVYVK